MSLGISGWEKCTLLTKPEQSGKTILMLQKIVEDLSEDPREDGKKNVNFIICDNNLLLVLQTSERLNTDDELCRFRNIETGELYSMSSPTETKKMTFPTTEKKIAMKPKMKKEKSAEEITVWEEFQAFKNMKIQKERDAAATMEAEAERVVKQKKWNEENGVEELRSDKEKEIKEFQKKIDTLRKEIKEAEGKNPHKKSSSRGGVRAEGTSVGATWIEKKLATTPKRDCYKCVGCPKVYFSDGALETHRKKCTKVGWIYAEDTEENRKYWRRS